MVSILLLFMLLIEVVFIPESTATSYTAAYSPAYQSTYSTNRACPTCQTVMEGPLKGLYWLKWENQAICPNGCVYENLVTCKLYCFEENGLYYTQTTCPQEGIQETTVLFEEDGYIYEQYERYNEYSGEIEIKVPPHGYVHGQTMYLTTNNASKYQDMYVESDGATCRIKRVPDYIKPRDIYTRASDFTYSAYKRGKTETYYNIGYDYEKGSIEEVKHYGLAAYNECRDKNIIRTRDVSYCEEDRDYYTSGGLQYVEDSYYGVDNYQKPTCEYEVICSSSSTANGHGCYRWVHGSTQVSAHILGYSAVCVLCCKTSDRKPDDVCMCSDITTRDKLLECAKATAINGECPEEHDLYSCGDGYCYKAIGDYLDCSRSEKKVCPEQFPVNCGDICYTKEYYNCDGRCIKKSEPCNGNCYGDKVFCDDICINKEEREIYYTTCGYDQCYPKSKPCNGNCPEGFKICYKACIPCSEPCNEKKCSSIRVRKNIKSLTPEEIADLNQALTALKSSGYVATAQYHGHSHWCCQHGNPLFPSWHTAYVMQLENALAQFLVDPNLGLPYWDWTEPSSNWIHLISNMGTLDLTNPWSFGHNPATNANTNRNPGTFNTAAYKSQMDNAKCEHDFVEFYPILENAHGSIHVTVGGSMASLAYAAFDPIFFLNHNFVEKIYEEWQLCRENANDTEWFHNVAQRNHPLQCFDNPSINPDPETLGLTMEALLVNKDERCYVYDTLTCNCGEKTGESGSSPGNGPRQYLVFNKRNIGVSATLKFNICLADTEKGYPTPCTTYIRGDLDSSVTFFGNEKKQEGYELYYHDITDALEKSQIPLKSNVYAEIESFKAVDGENLEQNQIDTVPYDVYRPTYDGPEYFIVQHGLVHNTTIEVEEGTVFVFIASDGKDLSVEEFEELLTGSEVIPTVGRHTYTYYITGTESKYALDVVVYELPVKCGKGKEVYSTTTKPAKTTTKTQPTKTTTSVPGLCGDPECDLVCTASQVCVATGKVCTRAPCCAAHECAYY